MRQSDRNNRLDSGNAISWFLLLSGILKRVERQHRAGLYSCFSMRYVLCVFPTGFGKTVVIEALPFIAEDLSTVLVACPLNGILENQLKRFGCAALLLSRECVEEIVCGSGALATQILMGEFRFVIGHPEQLTDPRLRDFYRKCHHRQVFSHLVIDEVHCLLSWGKSDFRPAFQRLGALRSTFTTMKCVALTATATPKSQDEILASLRMSKAQVLSVSPDRPNIYMGVTQRLPNVTSKGVAEDSVDDILNELLSELESAGPSFPKTVVFTKLKWCQYAATKFEKKLKGTTLENSFSQFHAAHVETEKAAILADLHSVNGKLRLLFATEALGMGVDVPDFRRAVHITPPTDMETYVQQIGRIGRDGQDATAVLYYNKSDIGRHVPHLSNEMRKFCLTESCRRHFILEYFGFSGSSDNGCQNCDNCNCVSKPPIENPRVRLSRNQKAYFSALLDLFRSKTSDSMPFAQLEHFLSESLARQIAANFDLYISHPEELRVLHPDIEVSSIKEIHDVLMIVESSSVPSSLSDLSPSSGSSESDESEDSVSSLTDVRDIDSAEDDVFDVDMEDLTDAV